MTRYQVWTDFAGGYAFRNAKYKTREKAERVLASIVWHNRHHFRVREVSGEFSEKETFAGE